MINNFKEILLILQIPTKSPFTNDARFEKDIFLIYLNMMIVAMHIIILLYFNPEYKILCFKESKFKSLEWIKRELMQDMPGVIELFI